MSQLTLYNAAGRSYGRSTYGGNTDSTEGNEGNEGRGRPPGGPSAARPEVGPYPEASLPSFASVKRSSRRRYFVSGRGAPGGADSFHAGFGGGGGVDVLEGPGRVVAHGLVVIG